MPEDGWAALAAEGRALRRATDAARLASYVYQDETQPAVLIARQVAWAKLAAFPPNRNIDHTTQRALLREIELQALFRGAPEAGSVGGPAPCVVETVPLSQISEGRLLSKRQRKSDAASDASSPGPACATAASRWGPRARKRSSAS